MEIALVFPKSTFLIDPMVYPPLGLWYLGAQLEAKGHKTHFRDLSEAEIPDDGEFDQVWFSATSAQMHELRRIGKIVQDWRETPTALGGAAVWTNPEQCRNLGFHTLVAGEADQPDLVDAVIEKASINLLTDEKTLLHFGTQDAEAMKTILPPIRRWSRQYEAWLTDRDGVDHLTTTLFTSRGCPMACAFCESGRNGVIWDKFVRYEPLGVVEQQLKEITELGFTGVMFYDDIFPLNKSRTLAIMALLRKYNLVWRCFLRSDIIAKQGRFDYLKDMADSGLLEVLAGVESADNRIKDNIWKGTTIEQDTQVLKWCKELGIKFKASLILGLPGEDHESLQRTEDWILKNRPDRVDVNILIPFPGTPLTAKADQFDLFWTEDYPEEFWFKGPRDESFGLVGTSSLEPLEIKAFRDQLIQKLVAEGIPY